MVPPLDASGPASGAIIGRTALETLVFVVHDDGVPLRWRLDGREVSPSPEGDRLVLRPGKLRDGPHELEIVADGGLYRGSARRAFTFTIDTKPPDVRLARPAVAFRGEVAEIDGMVEPGARLTANGRPVVVRDGRFALRYRAPRARPIILAATDAAGNTARWRMPVRAVPRRPAVPVRGVHVTARAWADPVCTRG